MFEHVDSSAHSSHNNYPPLALQGDPTAETPGDIPGKVDVSVGETPLCSRRTQRATISGVRGRPPSV